MSVLEKLESALYVAEDQWMAIRDMISQNVGPHWTPTSVFTFALVTAWLIYIWKMFLAFRQLRVYVINERVPTEICHLMDSESFVKARAYKIDTSRFVLIYGLYTHIVMTLCLLFNVVPLLWNFCGDLVLNSGYNPNNEILRSAVFIFVGTIISTIHEIPWDVYSTFVVEEKHGFNKQTCGFFIKDKIKSYILVNVTVIPIICGSIQIIKMGGDYFFLYLWAFVVCITLLFMVIYPTIIAPLFDKFVSLPEGNLRTRIEELCTQLKFPLTGLYVVLGARRSAHSNAYLYGFWRSKRIVLFDTIVQSYNPMNEESDDESSSKDSTTESARDENLATSEAPRGEQGSPAKSSKSSTPKKGCSDEEVLAVICHELGHWKHGHTLKGFIISQVHLMCCFIILATLYKNVTIYQAFGITDGTPILLGMMFIFEYIFSPYFVVIDFYMTCLTRRFEFEADNFARKMHKASYLRDALIKLNVDNLGFPINDWLYSMCNHSHPPLLERIAALGKND